MGEKDQESLQDYNERDRYLLAPLYKDREFEGPFVVIPADFHLFLETEPRVIPHYEFSESGVLAFDPVWGTCRIGAEPGDEIILDILRNPLTQRTMANEQLSLDKYVATVPATGDFPQWEHMLGSAIFTRKISEKSGIELAPMQQRIMEIRTILSDLGHVAYRHQGDWIFQGWGGPENLHEHGLEALLSVSGIGEILEGGGINPRDVIFPDVDDWIEAPAPDLCVDRVDYGAREIRRWLDLNPAIHFATSLDAFKVDDHHRLVMTSKEHAINFTKAYLLLSTENWSQPVHQLQLALQQALIKHVLCSDETATFSSDMENLRRYHPRDYMYTFDFDITWETVRSWDPFLSVTRHLMEEIGVNARRIFANVRKPQLASFLSSNDAGLNMPRPLEHYGPGMYTDQPLLPPNLTILPVETEDDVEDYRSRPDTVDIFLKPLKLRHVDPLYKDKSGKTHRLSETEPAIARLIEQQQRMLAQAYVARVHVNRQTKELIENAIADDEVLWQEALSRPRMSPGAFRRMLGEVAMVSAGHRMATVNYSDTGGFFRMPP